MKSMPVLFCAMLLAPLLTLRSAWGTETAPDTLVKSTTEEVLAVIRHSTDPPQLVEVAEAKVVPHFDFERMTRLAVGRGWHQASPQQQQTLQKEFHTLLVRTYAHVLASSKNKEVQLALSPLRAPAGNNDEVTVRTQVSAGGEKPVAIDYQMEKSPAGWKVFDVAVDGISLVTSYRQSFSDEIGKSGIEGLIKVLAAKNRDRREIRR